MPSTRGLVPREQSSDQTRETQDFVPDGSEETGENPLELHASGVLLV